MLEPGDNLWYQTQGYGATAPKLPYLTAEQNQRAERLRVARMLWKGWHKQCYLTERRSQFDFPEMEIQGRIWWPYIKFNVLKLVSTTLTDLLLGEEPALTSAVPEAQDALDDLKQRSDIDRVLYDAVRSSSWGGEAVVEIIRWQGEVYIQDANIREIFPLGERQPDGQYGSYRRYARAMSLEKTPRPLLLQTTYLPGLIQRQCFFLRDDKSLGDDAGLALWPVKDGQGKDLTPEEGTGMAWNSLVWLGNEMDEGCPTSDYDGLIELQDELNAKQTQIARVIAMHADPKIAFPQAAADPDGTVRSAKRAFFFRSKEEIPEYIVWNAQLEAAIEDRDFTLNALCMAAELSQGLLGIEKGGAPDSARKLRLQATKSLARAKRKAKFVKPFIRTALDTALLMIQVGKVVKVSMGVRGDDGDLDGADGGSGTAVDLRDGLPVDDLDQAQVIATLRPGATNMSLKRAVGIQITDPEAADAEVEAIEAEAEKATPSVNVTMPGHEPGAGGAGETNQTGSEIPAGTPAAGEVADKARGGA